LDYDYKNDFLVKITKYWNHSGENADSGEVYMTNMIENENISRFKRVFPDYSSECTDYFK
jgi:hypothetical protein